MAKKSTAKTDKASPKAPAKKGKQLPPFIEAAMAKKSKGKKGAC